MGTTDSEEATVIVNVAKVNDVATATAQTVTADEDIDQAITLAWNRYRWRSTNI